MKASSGIVWSLCDIIKNVQWMLKTLHCRCNEITLASQINYTGSIDGRLLNVQIRSSVLNHLEKIGGETTINKMRKRVNKTIPNTNTTKIQIIYNSHGKTPRMRDKNIKKKICQSIDKSNTKLNIYICIIKLQTFDYNIKE